MVYSSYVPARFARGGCQENLDSEDLARELQRCKALDIMNIRINRMVIACIRKGLKIGTSLFRQPKGEGICTAMAALYPQ